MFKVCHHAFVLGSKVSIGLAYHQLGDVTYEQPLYLYPTGQSEASYETFIFRNIFGGFEYKTHYEIELISFWAS